MSWKIGDERRTLVLDAGGVLVGEFIRDLLRQLSDDGGVSYDALIADYEATVRESLFTGEMRAEGDFWAWMRRATNTSVSDDELHSRALTMMYALSGMAEVNEWAKVVNVRLLSDHRAEWLRPRLIAEGVEAAFERAFISSETGLVKPDPRTFELAFEGLDPSQTLFVDDRQVNLDAAALLSVATLLADPQGQWVGKVDSWVDNDT